MVDVVGYFIIKGNEDICFPKGMVYHLDLDISSSGVTSEKEMMELVGYGLDDPLKRYAKYN